MSNGAELTNQRFRQLAENLSAASAVDPAFDMVVPDSLTVGGATALNGNVTVGNATTDLIAFHGSTATDQCAAYTQTFSTAGRTVPNATSTNPTPIAGGEPPTEGEHNIVITAVTALNADVAALKGVVNSLIDDLQEKGLVG